MLLFGTLHSSNVCRTDSSTCSGATSLTLGVEIKSYRFHASFHRMRMSHFDRATEQNTFPLTGNRSSSTFFANLRPKLPPYLNTFSSPTPGSSHSTSLRRRQSSVRPFMSPRKFTASYEAPPWLPATKPAREMPINAHFEADGLEASLSYAVLVHPFARLASIFKYPEYRPFVIAAPLPATMATRPTGMRRPANPTSPVKLVGIRMVAVTPPNRNNATSRCTTGTSPQ